MTQNMTPEMHPQISETGAWNSIFPYHTMSPGLSDWIVKYLENDKDKPLYDLGCGVGQYLNKLKNAGFTKLTGFEAFPAQVREFDNIVQQDLTKPFQVEVKSNVLFLEVAEHIPAEFENVMLDNVTNICSGHLIMSWAIRNQPGHGHVNCLENYEVIDRMTKRGFTFLANETTSARAAVSNATDLPWFQNTTLIFSKI